MLLIAFAALDHALNNLAIEAVNTNNTVVNAFVTPFEWLRRASPLYPVVALLIALVHDRRDVRLALAQDQEVCLTAERRATRRWLGLLRFALALRNKPWSLWRLWQFVLKRRAWALAQVTTQSTANSEQGAALVGIRHVIEQQEPSIKRIYPRLHVSIRQLIALVFALPALLYFGIGTWPRTNWVQRGLGTPVMLWVLVGLQVIGLLWLIVQLVAGLTRLPTLRKLTKAQVAIAVIFGMLIHAAVFLFSVVAVADVFTGREPFQSLLGTVHIADAVRQAVGYTWDAFTSFGVALMIGGHAFATGRWAVATGIPAVYNEPSTRGKVIIGTEIIRTDIEGKQGGAVVEEAPAPPTSSGDDSDRPPVPPPVAPGPPDESPDEEPEQPKNRPPFRPPNKRHYLRQVKQNSTAKPKNTIIEPRVDVAADVRAINAGQAQRVGDTYIINGRTYGVKDGTLYPITGDGFHLLSRMAYKALGIFNTFGNTAQANAILSRMTQLTAADKAAALAVWRLGL